LKLPIAYAISAGISFNQIYPFLRLIVHAAIVEKKACYIMLLYRLWKNQYPKVAEYALSYLFYSMKK